MPVIPSEQQTANVVAQRLAAGEMSLLDERLEHGGFLRQLFAAHAAAELAPLALPPAMLQHLIEMQFRAQGQSYRTRFLGARFLVVARAGQLIGRLIEDEEPDCVHIVDIAILPQFQGQGLGAALLRARMADWRAAGLGARSEVLTTNTRSLAMHRKLGFTIAGPPASAHLTLRWRAPASSE